MLATAFSRLRGYRATFFIVALLLCSVVVVVAGELSTKVGEQATRVSVTVREREGLAYTTLIVKTVRSLRQLRDRILFDGGDDRAQRRDVATALAALSSYENVSGRPFELAKRVEVLEGEWAAVPPGRAGAAAVSDVLNAATKLSSIASDRSSLVADPDGATAALVDAYGTQLPIVEQRIDDAKLVLYRARVAGGMSERDRVAAATLIGEARQAYLSADEEFENATRTVGDLPDIAAQLTSVGGSLDAFSSILDRSRPAASARSSAESLRAAADSVIDAVDIAYEGLGATIDANLRVREASEKEVMTTLLAAVATAIVLGVAFLVWLGVTMQRRYLRAQARNRRELERLEGELARQRLLDALEVTEAHFRAAFDRSSIGVAILGPDGSVLRTNARIHQLIDPVEPEAIGASAVDFRRLFAGEIESFTTELYRKEADAWFEATVSLVRDDDHEPRFAISMLKDVTERKKIADRFRHEAMHDALSGLPNRACFQEHVQSALSAPPGSGVRAVLYIDVDEFKLVNDSFGHEVGDRVIVWCAEQLRASVHPGDFVARFGGDEFAAFVSGPDLAYVEETVGRLGDALSETLVLDGRDIFIAVSIGIAYVDESYDSVDAIVRDADTAMYAAKASGTARWAVFDPSMREDVSRRVSLSLQLRRALEREQFHLVYQPVVSLSTGAIDSFEVLLRWDHPELGSVSPVEFIPLAEELGLIVPIGRFVLDGACAQFAAWKRDFPEQRPRRISVNCSVREIVQGDFVENVSLTLQRHGIEPEELVLEVTESTVLASGRTSGAPLERLRDIGVGLAIDDFGTGFSSLRYLQQFPFDTLKIDRSFVGGEDGGLASEAIVTMLLSLADAVGVSVTAEGVETAAQAKRLLELGCAEVQGYFFGRPTKASDVPSVFYRIAAVAS